MRAMDKEYRKGIEDNAIVMMEMAIGKDYAKSILEHENESTGKTFMDDVIEDIMIASAWEEEGICYIDDIRFAIGRILMRRMNIPV